MDFLITDERGRENQLFFFVWATIFPSDVSFEIKLEGPNCERDCAFALIYNITLFI